MANVLTDWRVALVGALTTAFPAPTTEVKSGQRSGVSRDKARIAVFSGGYREDGSRVVVGIPVMIVRYWPKRSKQPATNNPADPSQLEEAAVALMTALRPFQASLGVTNLWFFRVESVTVDDDPDEWGVEATLVGMGKNMAVLA